MGRTKHKFTEHDDDRNHRTHKGAKHSRNIPGKGMRIINTWSEEDDYMLEDSVDLEEKITFELITHR